MQCYSVKQNLYVQLVWQILSRKANRVLKHCTADTWGLAGAQGDLEQRELATFPQTILPPSYDAEIFFLLVSTWNAKKWNISIYRRTFCNFF